jgi:hypothetical protein
MFPVPHRSLGRLRRRSIMGIVAVVAVGALLANPAAMAPGRAGTAAPEQSGYWLVASDGGIFAFGNARFFGSTGAIKLNQPIVGVAPTPSGNGYWLVASDGGIFAFGDARFFGSTGAIKLNQPIVGMAPTPSGNGYWLVASDGGIFAFGDAQFYGSTGAIKLNRPITGMTTSATGQGYRMVASDGGIFSFGDARFYGSRGGTPLARPMSGMAPTPSGNGYWMTATDATVFAFGDASSFGSAAERPSGGPRTMVAMTPTPSGNGYWEASTTGEVLAFGDAPDLGGLSRLNRPIVAMAAVPGTVDAPAAGDPSTAAPGSTTVTGTTPTTEPMPGQIVPPTGGIPQRFSSKANITWGTPGDPNRAGYAQEVDAIAEAGDTVFVAGQFTDMVDPSGGAASPPQPYLVALNVNTGAPVGSFNATANPDGPVLALAVSADGRRLYVGGKFTTIGGQSIRRFAALDPNTGQVDPGFNPPTPSAYVNAITLSGNRLYLGGAFSSMGTGSAAVASSQITAVDAVTGAIIPGFVPHQNYGGVFETHTGKAVEDQPDSYNPGVVDAIAVTGDGATVLAGGNFLHFGTDPASDPNHQHAGLVALDAATGALSSWQPVSTRPTFGLTTSPSDGTTIFAAAGGAGGVVAAFVVGKNPKPVWTGHVDGDARGVAATTQRVYLVGHYDHQVPNANDPCLTTFTPQPPDGHLGISCPNGTPHRHLAAFDAKTGNVDPTFTAQADTSEGPDVAVVGAHNLYVGGNFLQVRDSPTGKHQPQPGFAMYPANG